MTDEQRALAEQRLDARWSRMSLEGKTQLMRLHRALAEMPPDERKFIHDRIERFLNMTPAERDQLNRTESDGSRCHPRNGNGPGRNSAAAVRNLNNDGVAIIRERSHRRIRRRPPSRRRRPRPLYPPAP